MNPIRSAARHLGYALLAALLVTLGTATLLSLVFLLSDPAANLPDLGYAWVSLLAVGLMLAVPVALAFSLTAAPLAALLRPVHPGLSWLAVASVGTALAYLMTAPKLAVLGTIGGLVYLALVSRGAVKGR